MTDTAMVPRNNGRQPAPLIDEQPADDLLGKAHAEGVELLGPDGLLSQVTKAVQPATPARAYYPAAAREALHPSRTTGPSRRRTERRRSMGAISAARVLPS